MDTAQELSNSGCYAPGQNPLEFTGGGKWQSIQVEWRFREWVHHGRQCTYSTQRWNWIPLLHTNCLSDETFLFARGPLQPLFRWEAFHSHFLLHKPALPTLSDVSTLGLFHKRRTFHVVKINLPLTQVHYDLLGEWIHRYHEMQAQCVCGNIEICTENYWENTRI
jgi:hypothetical protein